MVFDSHHFDTLPGLHACKHHYLIVLAIEFLRILGCIARDMCVVVVVVACHIPIVNVILQDIRYGGCCLLRNFSLLRLG